ncbi:MAG: hypothetical protein QM774_03550 [Gordonia sp. (in: high G+C Gram-positive bacteria)]|uniref:hypothetical protein n=1 Tax=Gordonia sp. (in: high G+C Gram-positive bacteria) TaxID=84139 RepID=UPI0039E5C043
MRVAASAIAVLAAVLVLAGCSAFSSSSTPEDLSGRALAPGDFPFGPANRIPTAQVPGILADITLRPLSGDVDPSRCTPAGVQTGNAVVLVGPGGTDGMSTLTSAVTQTAESFDEFVGAARDCASFRTGATGAQTVTTDIVEGPETTDPVPTVHLRRTLASTGDQGPPTVIEEWVAQGGDVRVYVQDRRTGGTMTPDEAQKAEDLFAAARTKAFGRA